MPTPSNLAATDYIRRGHGSSAAPRTTTGTELELSDGTSAQHAIAHVIGKTHERREVSMFGVIDSFKLSHGRAVMQAKLDGAAIEHETRLRLKVMAGQMSLLEKRIDTSLTSLHAALGTENLASEGRLIRALQAVRHEVKLALIEDRYGVIDAYVAKHAAGRLSDDELQAALESVTADYRGSDQQVAESALNYLREVSEMLRPQGAR